MSTIANIIRDQIGSKALYMIGAKNLATNGNDLSFRIRGSRTANHVKITLTPMDLYDVEYSKVRGQTVKQVAVEEGIYADMLHASIERNTGLYTSL